MILKELRQSRMDLLRNRFINIIIKLAMDVRLKKEEEDNINEMKDDKLADSLIYNILKKLELRMAMEEKYEVARAPQLSIIPHQMGRHLHSTLGMGYLSIAMGSILYLRYKRKMTLSLRSFLPHFMIAISINEYERYRNIMNIDPQMCNQFKSYQANSKTIIEQMKSRVSLTDQIKKMNLVTYEKTLLMLKYRPLY